MSTQFQNRLYLWCIIIILVCASFGRVCATQEAFTKDQLKTLATFKKIDEYPLYEMHYFHDYRFDEFLKKGETSKNDESTKRNECDKVFACTCFSTLDKNHDKLFGRNFDWYQHPAMILFTYPEDGYRSVSMIDISYLNFEDDGNEPTLTEKKNLLNAPFLPFDGMNEHGLAAGLMAVRHAKDRHDPQKVTIRTLHVIRLMLDYAKNIDEALLLLDKYNIEFGKPPVHYLIADASGQSAILEFVKGKRFIMYNQDPWQVSTNFIFSEIEREARKSICWRFRRAENTLKSTNGAIQPGDAMHLLETVSQRTTVWTAVYNLTTLDVMVVMGREYDKVYRFKVEGYTF